ncbi:MAG: hypothetical protein ABIA59_01665 [Candidatus Latescibacterota bacterium]
MKIKWIVFGLIVLGLILPISSCKEFVSGYIIFIDEEGCVPKGMDGNPIKTLWVFPGDKVVWINTSSELAAIEFDNASIFGSLRLNIDPGKRLISTVQKDATGSFDYTITPCASKTGPSKFNILDGTPKGNIGDEP